MKITGVEITREEKEYLDSIIQRGECDHVRCMDCPMLGVNCLDAPKGDNAKFYLSIAKVVG